MKSIFPNTNLLLFILFSIPPFYMTGQELKGIVIDKNLQEALPFANVILLHASDSGYIKGTVTDEEGAFTLSLPHPSCLLQVSFVGYESQVIPVHSYDDIKIGLSPKDEYLSEVIIKGTAKTFRIENGGISADIRNSYLKEMGNLPEVLGQLPFVRKEDESYTVIGRGSPVFYINNRLVRDPNELRQINSREIKKITVITDPGPEYDSSVNAVIKIETLRPVGEGISGNFFSYNRYNTKWSTFNTLRLNYRKAGLDIFAGLQFADAQFPKDRMIINGIGIKDRWTTITSFSKQNDGLRYLVPGIGFNYMIHAQHSLGARYEYGDYYDQYGYGHTDIEVYKENMFQERLISDYTIKIGNYSHYINAYYNGQLTEWLHLKMDMDYKTNDGDRTSVAINTLQDQSLQNIITGETSKYHIYAGKVSLNSTVWDGDLTLGTEITYTDNDQNVTVIENTDIPGIVPTQNYAEQNLAAGFLSYGKSFGRFSASLGARYENIHFRYYLDNQLVEEQSKNYTKLFPNLRLSYHNDHIQMQFAYRQTVTRPAYNELRATIFYSAPYSYHGGDPLLQPGYKNSLSYTFMWKNITFMTTYSDYKDHIAEMPELYMENSLLFKFANLDKKEWIVTANYSPAIKIWKPNLEVTLQKEFLDYGNPPIPYNTPMFYFNFRNNIRLKGWQLGMDITARTRGNDNTQYRKASWQTAVYINKSFFKESLSLNIRGNDLFNTSNDEMEFRFNNLISYYNNSMYRRNLAIQITWHFNPSQNRYKGTRATDELDRL